MSVICGEYYSRQETKITWRVSTKKRCGNCLVYFHDPPASIITPTPERDTIALFGTYCSWNCSKRALFDLRTRPWFSLMAITALQLGARLPITMSDRKQPPLKKDKQIVSQKRITWFDKKIIYKESIIITQLPTRNPSANPEAEGEEEEEEAEPVAFESVSGIQSLAMMGV